MIIILDTNIYFDNWFLTSPQFALLASYCKNTSATLLVPQVVVDEIEAKFDQKWTAFIEILEGLPRQFEEFRVVQSQLPSMPSKPVYEFASVVRRHFRNSIVLTYENLPHGPLVKKAIHSRRPFREKEKGYRDSLMWESVLTYLSSTNSVMPVAFINANTKDFWEQGTESSRLHPDLREDLISRKIENSFLLYSTLRQFTDTHIEKSVLNFDEDQFKERYQDEIEDIAQDAAMVHLNDLEVPAVRAILVDAGFSARAAQAINQTRWTLFEGIEDYEFLSFARITSDQIYVSFKFDMRMLDLEVDMFASEYFSNKADLDGEFINHDVNSQYAHMNTILRGDFKAGILFDTKKETVDQISIDAVRIYDRRY